MVGWHHRLDGHEFEQALGVGDKQGSLACCDSWGCKESDTTERLNNSSSPMPCPASGLKFRVHMCLDLDCYLAYDLK